MFRAISRRWRRNVAGSDYPDRYWRLLAYRRVLEGTLYDDLPYDFHEEYTDGGEYIPLRDRAPSVRYNLCRTVVDDSVSLLFSEAHFPTIDCDDVPAREAMLALVKHTNLNATMIDAAIRGSIGSAAVLFQVLLGRPFFSVLDVLTLTPEWDREAPDTLVRVTERYRVSGRELRAAGYQVDDRELDARFWFQRIWDARAETWFVPWLEDDAVPVVDVGRSVQHGLGFCPVVWIKNLPGGDAVDGACTFRGAIETSVEIDYQLSQAGRGLKYSSEPTLLIKEPAGAPLEPERKHGGGNALVLSEGGDAKLLEIDGGASQAVIEYVRTLRELALESIHGNRASPERLTAAQSGRAMELMNQGLVWLADNLRISYGEDALLRLLRMVVVASGRYPLMVAGEALPKLDPNVKLVLKWPRFYAPTAEDLRADAMTLQVLGQAGHISEETAVKSLASNYDIEDVPAELARIEADRQRAADRMTAEGVQMQDKVSEPV